MNNSSFFDQSRIAKLHDRDCNAAMRDIMRNAIDHLNDRKLIDIAHESINHIKSIDIDSRMQYDSMNDRFAMNINRKRIIHALMHCIIDRESFIALCDMQFIYAIYDFAMIDCDSQIHSIIIDFDDDISELMK